mmetsp:Transcript_63864/g.119820  ORF Transcript_63864/g.119820 Transcript_63864/m.119820 type:complete len:80 (+) Transcript_63864:772-1011(+)
MSPITDTKAATPGTYSAVSGAHNSGEWENPGGFYEAGLAAADPAFDKHNAGRKKQTTKPARERKRESGANPTFIGVEWS